MVALLLLIGLLALAAAAVLGKTYDSRDPEFSMGRVLGWTRRTGLDVPPAGTLPTNPKPS